MNEQCNDNRFEIIKETKEYIISATNIDTSPDEMKVLDDICFRLWQLGLTKRNKDKLTELKEKTKEPVYTLEEVKKEWEALGYELINDYCSDFHFVRKIENTIYNRPIYHHFEIEKINGGRYIPYSSFEKDDNFNNRQYFVISFQEHQLITKTFKALGWE